MKVFNIVLSVLILLLAITAVVFGIFLYEKRTQLTGWGNDLGKAIYSASTTLDSGSGSNYAAGLGGDNLSHLKYGELSSKTSRFQEQVRNIIAQRDALAEALAAVVRATGSSNGTLYTNAETYEDVANYATYIEQPRSLVQAIRTQIDTIAREMVNFARALEYPTAGLTADAAYFSDLTKSRDTYKGMIDKASAWVAETKMFRAGVVNIYKALGKGDTVIAMDLATSQKAVAAVIEAAGDLREEAKDLKDSLDAANATIAARDSEIAALKRTIAELNATIVAKEDEIVKLNAVIGAENGRLDPEEWAPGCISSRRAMRGRVIAVNEKFGIVTIDLGKNTRVSQLVGRHWVNVDPMVEELAARDINLVVMRENDEGHAEYVAELNIVRVDDACSITEIVREDASGEIKVGDIVVIAEEDLVAAK